MREGWTYKKLGEVCTIIGRIGFRGYKRTDYVDSEKEGAISLSPSNIIDGKLDYSKNTYITWDKYEESPEIKIFNGDVLLVKTASVGKSAIVRNLPHEATINPQFVVLKNIITNNEYLAYVIRSMSFLRQLQQITSGSSVPTLSQKALAELIIPLPPKSQQEAIVSELDEINSLLDLKREQLQKYDKLAQSLFYEMFGDPVENEKGFEIVRLGDICTQIKDGVHAKPQYVDMGIPFVSVVNINKGVLNLNDCKYISQEAFAKMSKSFKAEKGDILYSKVGATYGIPALVETDEKFGLYVSVSLLKPKKDIILSKFLKATMGLQYIKEQADKGIKGIGVPDLHLSVIKEFQVLLPPLPLQQQFASRIEQIESQKQQVQASIEKLETLLASRMQYWFE